MAWQSGAAGSGAGGMPAGEQTGVQAYTLQGITRSLSTIRTLSRLTFEQVLCDFFRPNGTDMKEIGIPGRSNVKR